MSRWAALASAGYFLYRMAKKFVVQARQKDNLHLESGTDMAKCPRCYTYVDVDTTMRASVDGISMQFCSPECLEAYRRYEQDIDARAMNNPDENKNI